MSSLTFRQIALLGVVALSMAACSSTGTNRVSMNSMCKAAGGTYSGGTCEPAKQSQTAAKLCAAHGGQYFEGGDYCEVDSGLLWKPLP